MVDNSVLFTESLEDLVFVRENICKSIRYASDASMLKQIFERFSSCFVLAQPLLYSEGCGSLAKTNQDNYCKYSSIQELGNILNKSESLNKKTPAEKYKKICLQSPTFASIVGKSAAMQKLRNDIVRIASFDVSVLILGETGTGKTTVARAIHEVSGRRTKPFLHEVISNSNESVIESKLFGVSSGAFTGAVAGKGVFEEADGGTLFLDEIGEISPNIQTKLLHVLSEGLISRIGSNKKIPVDNRMIFATNANLEAKIRQGTFREDLFYRINDVTIRIPPLRERLEDIPKLAEAYLRKKKINKKISDSALAALQTFSWKGNVRQLEKVLKNAALLYCDGDTIEPKDIRL